MAGRRSETEYRKHHAERAKSMRNPARDGSSGSQNPGETEAQAPQEEGFDRPTKYDADAADAILARVAQGETLTAICREPGQPRLNAVYEWRKASPEFAQAFIQARIDQMQAWADQIITLADDVSEDLVRDPATGKVLLDAKDRQVRHREGPQRSRLRIETRQWLMERIAREEYGLRQTLDVHLSLHNKDDAEIMHELRLAAEAAGLTAAELAALVASEDDAEGPVT